MIRIKWNRSGSQKKKGENIHKKGLWGTQIKFITFSFFRGQLLCVCAESLQSCLTFCDPMDRQLARFLCPWNSPGKNTGMGYHTLFLGIFLIHRSNPSLLCVLQWQEDSLPLAPPGNSLRALESESRSVVSDSL